LATNLITAGLNPNATGNYGDSTLAVLGDFYTYMTLYVAWGGNGPPPAALIQAQTAISQITIDMSK